MHPSSGASIDKISHRIFPSGSLYQEEETQECHEEAQIVGHITIIGCHCSCYVENAYKQHLPQHFERLQAFLYVWSIGIVESHRTEGFAQSYYHRCSDKCRAEIAQCQACYHQHYKQHDMPRAQGAKRIHKCQIGGLGRHYQYSCHYAKHHIHLIGA